MHDNMCTKKNVCVQLEIIKYHMLLHKTNKNIFLDPSAVAYLLKETVFWKKSPTTKKCFILCRKKLEELLCAESTSEVYPSSNDFTNFSSVF